MRLKYMFANKRKTYAPPFHVKSTLQSSIQGSVALEDYLEETKLELASVVFHTLLDNISANERTQRNQSQKTLTKERLQSLWIPHKK